VVAGSLTKIQAEPHERTLILLWTLAACGVAGAVYAIVSARQSRDGTNDD